MIKLLKYEMKSTSKFMLSLAAAVLFASLMFNWSVKSSIVQVYNNPESSPIMSTNLHFLPISFAVIIAFGASISFFFYLAGRLNRELYDDERYLTFSLPLTDYQILGAKSISAILWGAFQLISVALSTFIFHRLFMWDIFASGWKEFMGFWTSSEGLYSLSYLALTILLGIMLVYFSILLSKVFFRPERGRWIWFLVLMVVLFINNQFLVTLSKLFVKPLVVDGMIWEGIGPHLFYAMSQRTMLHQFLVLTFALIFFVVNGYLLDKKVEL